MVLTLEEVKHIADLARLALTAEEEQAYREQLSAVLDYVARLQEVDTSDVPPTASVLSSASPLRDDEVQPGLTREALLANAPDTLDGQFRVPPVFPAEDET